MPVSGRAGKMMFVCVLCMLCLQLSCVSFRSHTSSLNVSLNESYGDAVEVDLYRMSSGGRKSFVHLRTPRNGVVVFKELSSGTYRVVVGPAVDSYAAQYIVATNIFVSGPTQMSMTVPYGKVRVKCVFDNYPEPSWWSPTDAAPICVERCLADGSLDDSFRLYLWIRKGADRNWEGDLHFLDEGTYVFTLFESYSDKGKAVIRDIQARSIRIDRAMLDGGIVGIKF